LENQNIAKRIDFAQPKYTYQLISSRNFHFL
jgi:hypothetical protein